MVNVNIVKLEELCPACRAYLWHDKFNKAIFCKRCAFITKEN